MTVDPNISLVAIALLNLATAIITWRTHQQSKANGLVITELEKNTNSIKDALVASTAKASYSEGQTQAREAGELKAANLLKDNKK